MNRKSFLFLVLVLIGSSRIALAGLTDGDIKVKGDKSDLRGVMSLSIRYEIRGVNFYLKGKGDSGATTNDVKLDITQALEKAGLSVSADSPTILTVLFDTPGGTFMTYVNFILHERATLLRDKTVERKILIWMATGYESTQVFPEPVRRLTRTFIAHWAEANGKEVSLSPEKKPIVIIVKLLPGKQFELSGKKYPHDKLLAVIQAMPQVEKKLIKVQSGWNTRADAGPLFRVLKDAGLKAKIDFRFGEGGADEKGFMKEWEAISGDEKK